MLVPATVMSISSAVLGSTETRCNPDYTRALMISSQLDQQASALSSAAYSCSHVSHNTRVPSVARIFTSRLGFGATRLGLMPRNFTLARHRPWHLQHAVCSLPPLALHAN